MITTEAMRALTMSFIAGMSTLLGALIIVFTKNKSEKLVTISLGFAAGVMMSVSFTDMLPHASEALNNFVGEKAGIILSVIFVVMGVLLATGIDRLVPHNESITDFGREHANLYRAGFISMLAIALHNFPEGIATFMAGYENITLGITITVAIALHNIPEGIAIAMPIYFATGKRKKAFKYVLIASLAEPIGAILTFLVLQPFINDLLMGVIFAIIAGIMLYIVIEELIPSSRQYGYSSLAITATFVGICLMPLTGVFGV